MAKDAHEPDELTKPISILQVIGDNDKSYHGSTNPKITMYSAAERIEIWRTFNQCGPEPVIEEQGDEIVWHTYSGTFAATSQAAMAVLQHSHYPPSLTGLR